jgi:hypothetical protein
MQNIAKRCIGIINAKRPLIKSKLGSEFEFNVSNAKKKKVIKTAI